MRITFLIIAAFGWLATGLSQNKSTRRPASKSSHKLEHKSPDIAQLRERFTATVGKDFAVLKDEMKARANARGGGNYWLVHVKARHSGYYLLTYSYKENDPHYSHVERDFMLNIGPAGCHRGPPYTGSYARFCVGDTIIVPIIINNFSAHEFKLKSQEYSSKDDDVFEKERPSDNDTNVNSAPVPNPSSDLMRYVGSSSHKMLHRNGGYTLENYATFEAVKPGRLNLAVGTSPRTSPDDGVSIIIVARGTPVTLLASHQDVRGYSQGYDGREWVSSSSGDAFMSNLMILQPGDRISVEYYSIIKSREFEMREGPGSVGSESESTEKVPPVISKLPFKLKLDYDFTDWLTDYLPK